MCPFFIFWKNPYIVNVYNVNCDNIFSMKKFAKFLLASLVASSIILSGCDKQTDPPKEECTNHYDSNLDGKCDYCGADILEGPNGEPILSEVNSNAFYEGIEKTTGVNVAGCYVDYLIKKNY